jgi:hypothetical protein
MTKRTRQQAKSKGSANVREVFSVRFSRQELNQLRLAAKAQGSTIAGIVRQIVIGNLVPQVIPLGSKTATPSIRVNGPFGVPESYNVA